MSFLKQLCWRHHLSVLLRLCATHLFDVPQRLLWVCAFYYFFDNLSRPRRFLCLTSLLLSAAPSQRSFSPTSPRWTSQTRATSISPQPSLPPWRGRRWQTRVCSTPPPRSTVPVPAAPVSSWERTSMTLPPVPMGPTVLTASKQTAGGPSTYNGTWNDWILNYFVCPECRTQCTKRKQTWLWAFVGQFLGRTGTLQLLL